MAILHPDGEQSPDGRALPAAPTWSSSFHAVQHAFRVLESISRHGDGVGAEEVARETGLPTAHLARMLLMLRREGYVEQVSDGGYVVGEPLVLLGSGADRSSALRDRIQRGLDQLRDATGAAVYLSRYQDGRVAVTHFSDAPGVPRVNEWVEFDSAAHATALGKCLLAQLDQDGRREYLSRHKPVRLTSRTITSTEGLLASLDRQAATVPTLDLQEYAVGTVCAAVPLTAGAQVGCLALSLPVDQAHRLRAAARRLNEMAGELLLGMAI